jgi:hypothetical protein
LANTDLAVTQGHDAVEQLEQSGTLDEVADDAGVDPDELREELLEDSSMFLTDTGSVGYAEIATALQSDAASSTIPASSGGASSLQVATLSSQPASSNVLYLDFDGHVTADPDWRSIAPGDPAVITSAPFSLDGDPAFSPSEQAIIAEVWQRVSEDYLPFDVNVTTADPGPFSGSGQRIVITSTNWTGDASVLGIALVGKFGSTADKPAFVFASPAFGPIAKSIAESVSHEAGHTFGLYHHGQGGLDYYIGHNGWAPIMGQPVSAQPPITQWARGEYSGATRPNQDDLGVIASRIGYAVDNAGGTTCSAVVVSRSSLTRGSVGSTGDRDVFAVDVGSGQLSVTLRPPVGSASWSNLFAMVTVRGVDGRVVATARPSEPGSWTANLVANVQGGRYFIEVDPIGWRTPIDGFSVYGSLGAYELSVDGAAGAPPPPPLAVCRSAFTPVKPARLVDTRNGLGAVGRVAAGRQVVVQVADGVRVPADATAAVVNVAAVNPSAAGFITVYPCSDGVPDTSTLNFVAGQTVANTTIAALSPAGQLCAWTYAETDILVDITGWLSPSGASRLTPIGPARVVDTRSGMGGVRLVAGQTLTVDLNGAVPAGSNAVAVNVTAVNAAVPGFLTVFPCSGAIPNTSTVNFVGNEARPNNTIVGLSGGRICIFSDAATDVLVDLLGSFAGEGLAYQPTSPVRVLDTRRTGTLGAGAVAAYSVGAAGLGAQAPGAAYVNVTAANHVVPGYVTTYDCVTRGDTSTLNQKVGQATANGAIVPLSSLQSCGWTYGGGDLIVDLNGWWVP